MASYQITSLKNSHKNKRKLENRFFICILQLSSFQKDSKDRSDGIRRTNKVNGLCQHDDSNNLQPRSSSYQINRSSQVNKLGIWPDPTWPTSSPSKKVQHGHVSTQIQRITRPHLRSKMKSMPFRNQTWYDPNKPMHRGVVSDSNLGGGIPDCIFKRKYQNKLTN